MQLNPTQAEIAEAAKQYEDKGRKEIVASLKERIGEIEAVHDQLSAKYDWSAVTKLDGTSDDKRNAFRKMNADVCALRDRMREIQGIDKSKQDKDMAAEIAERNGGSRPSDPAARAEAERLAAMPQADLEAYQSTRFLREAAKQAGIEIKGEGLGKDSICFQIATRPHGLDGVSVPLDWMVGPRSPTNVLSGGPTGGPGGATVPGAGGGWSIYPPMTDTRIDTPWPPVFVMDLVRRLRTTSNLFVYRAQSVPGHTDNLGQLKLDGADAAAKAAAAGWTAEDTEGAEIRPKWVTKTSPVVKCLAFAEITEEQIEDGQDIDGLVADQLRRELRNSVERDLLLGTGANNRMQGIFGYSLPGTSTTDFVAPASGTTDYGFDYISHGIFTMMKEIWMMPDRVVMHPLDWHKLSTTRDTQGRLQFMDPTEAAAKRVLGLPVSFTPWMAEDASQGTVGLGAFASAAALIDRRDVQLSRTDAHDENFTKDVLTIKASVRVAAARFYDSAFRRVTNFEGKKSTA